jgi:Tfp pilus assembly protein PilO
MAPAQANRLWIMGGALLAALLFGLGWLLLIHPRLNETAGLREETALTDTSTGALREKLVKLRQEAGHLGSYQSTLDSQRRALPTSAALADFLRELHAAGDEHGAPVTNVLVGLPNSVKAAGGLYSLGVTLTAEGPIGSLEQFLNQVQQLQPRAALIDTISTVPKDQQRGIDGTVTLTVTLQVFVARPNATPGAQSAPTSTAPTAPTSTAPTAPTSTSPTATPTG